MKTKILFYAIILIILVTGCSKEQSIYKSNYILKHDVQCSPKEYQWTFDISLSTPDTLLAIKLLDSTNSTYLQYKHELNLSSAVVTNMMIVRNVYVNNVVVISYIFTITFDKWREYCDRTTNFYPMPTSTNKDSFEKEYLNNEINRLGGINNIDTIWISFEGNQSGW